MFGRLAKAFSKFYFIIIILLLISIIIQNTALNYFPVCLHGRLKAAWTQLSNFFFFNTFKKILKLSCIRWLFK